MCDENGDIVLKVFSWRVVRVVLGMRIGECELEGVSVGVWVCRDGGSKKGRVL